MTNAFLETRQYRLLVAGIDVDDTVRIKADLGESRREQVLARDAPQDFALGPRCDAGGEQGGSRAVDRGVATSCHFVQRPERQTAAWKPAVDRLDPERQHRARTRRHAFKALNLLAKP